jgi:acyl-CoA synthetase (AMP-forming)/AMP-acid ligase II
MLEKKWEKTIWPGAKPMVPALPDRPIFEEIRQQAVQRPDKTAINFYGYEVSYKMLDVLSDRFANALISLGVGKGDRVGIYLENCPQFAIAFYGILKIGAVAVTCSPMYTVDELEHELNDAGVYVILLEDTFYPVLAAVSGKAMPRHVIVTSFADFLPENPMISLHETMSTEKQFIEGTEDLMTLLEDSNDTPPPTVDIDLENDLALLQYTAGTTGFPKGAMLTHGNLAVHGRAVRHYYEYEENDVHLLLLPIFHVTGLDIAMNPALAHGSTLIMLARFDLLAMLDVITRFKVTHMVTIAPINVAVINFPNLDDYDFSSLRLVLSGGAPVPSEIHKKWQILTGTPLVEGYGLSECTGGIIGNNRQHWRPGTVGGPVYFHDIRLVDMDTGEDAAEGGHGELWIKGPCVMKGYWLAKEQTRSVLTSDGWLKTGDIATIDENGWVSIVGRSKEMIKVSGYSVFLAEIDAVLFQHPAIAEAATVGVSHPYRGEEPKSFVVLASGHKDKTTETEIIDFCKQKLAAYKYPRKIEFIDALPKSGAGKVLRRELMKFS